jgi:hypothetical protein
MLAGQKAPARQRRWLQLFFRGMESSFFLCVKKKNRNVTDVTRTVDSRVNTGSSAGFVFKGDSCFHSEKPDLSRFRAI